MSDRDNVIGTYVNDLDKQRIENYREKHDLNQSQAMRRLADRGLEYEESWGMVRDIALAATAWAAAATGATVVFDMIPSTLTMWSIVFAGVLLTTYAVHLARWRYLHE